MEANTRKRTIKIVVLVVALTSVFLLAVLTPVGFMTYFVVVGPIQDARLQNRMLCKTDHQALLGECRELSKQIVLENAQRGVEVGMRVPDSKLSRFPIIKSVGARVMIDISGRVSIAGGGTLRHFGIDAYPEDFREPFSNFNYGDKELVPGLWYYDDRYNKEDNYDQVIDDLLKKR